MATNRTRGTGRRRRSRGAAGAAALAVAALAACASAPAGAEDQVALDYWLWDANQLPAYQACIDEFSAQNPDIRVRISQYGWDDYWQKITAGFVAGAGPDVFTDHLTRYPDYASRGLLLNIDELEATAAVDLGQYQEGLADLWVTPDGARYGLPKDFDTIALFYDENLLTEAGLTPEDLQDLTWNPEDGGTFEDVIARLSIDANGVRGDEDGFDPSNVATYGYASNGSGGAEGQTQWSWLAASTGWTFTNEPVWGTEYHYDDPRLQDTLSWYFGLVDKGFMAPYAEAGTNPNPTQALASGRGAISSNGSWMIRSYANLEGIDLGIAPLPAGPIGHATSMYNGLADSISAQTENPEEAARLVAFLGSQDCQVIVGQAGVVFPAIPAGTDAAAAAFADQGVDVAPFTDLVEAGDTFFFPVTQAQASVSALMTPIMDEIYIGSRDPATLTEVNEQVNALLADAG